MAGSGNDQRIDYVEFSVSDIARTREFYGTAFGWSFTDYGPGYCSFDDGRLSGGFALAGDDTGRSAVHTGGPLVILYADDLEGTQRRVEKAGGKIVKPIFSFPGGRRFHFTDPDGYELAVWSEG
jgi:hypothetical protein